MLIDRIRLKKEARRQLGGHIFRDNWLYALLACFLATFIMWIVPFFAFVILGGPVTYGLCRYFINSKDKTGDLSDLFKGFEENFPESLLLWIIERIFIMLWSILFIIPGIVKFYSYSMSMYILQDEKDKSWDYCHEKSMKMMEGHKMELFILDLSFLGWYIVGAICFGVGILWVLPYHAATRMNFYLSLKGEFAPHDVVNEQ